MNRITVALYKDEQDALLKLSAKERRDPRAQAAVLIRRELERAGLLHSNTNTAQIQHVRPISA